MSSSNDVITLICKPRPDKPAKKREVFADVLPVKRTEFYKAQSLGIMPQITFKLFKYDYNDENRVEYNKKLYALVRSYPVPGSEKVELTCAGIELSQTNCKLLILKKVVSKDSDGFGEDVHEVVAELYAYKEDSSLNSLTKERSTIAGDFPQVGVVFRFLKPCFELTSDYDISMNGQLYNIRTITEVIGREEFLEVVAVSIGLYGRG